MQLKTPKGRSVHVFGDASLVTLDRFGVIGERLDVDPRIASVSVIFHPDRSEGLLRATAPAGVAVVVAGDLSEIAGDVQPGATPAEVMAWARAASERGLWHDWLFTRDVAVRRAPLLFEPSVMDLEEMLDPSGSHFRVFEQAAPTEQLTIAIDVTWLGPHETGAQVLTTSAVDALANDERVTAITLFGSEQLPPYAQHVLEHVKVNLEPALEATASSHSPSDIVWFPNQIDQRSNIADARARGRRIITTYLDLIAYDIPRYHASHEAWSAYRRLQRRIALTVDGITTISADVAKRLYQEVPRLETARILPIPLGLDHITVQHVPAEPPMDIAHVAQAVGARPFVLVLGNDFQHKNRDFAIKVWQEVLRKGISCDLVLAGLHVRGSSSRPAEEQLFASHVDLRGAAHTLDHVSHESRAWLLSHAAAVLYPSSAEGFGFIPYEAAAMGVPSTFAHFGPLAELTGVRDAPRSWTSAEFATDLGMLLTNREHHDARVQQLLEAVAKQSWVKFADTLIGFFFTISGMPSVQTSAIGADSTRDAAALAAVLSSKTWRVAERLRRWKLGS